MKVFRNATRLDKVRWLMVYMTDFMMMFSFIGFVTLVVFAQQGVFPLPLIIAEGVLLVVFYALSTRPFRIAVRGGPRPTVLLAVSGVICLALMAGFTLFALPVWLSMMAPFVRRRTLLILCVSLVGAVCGVAAFGGVEALLAILLAEVVATAILVGGVLANLWLWRVTVEAYDGQEARALLAVADERLRFARDLNDLLGRGLVDIEVRTAHAESLVHADTGAAAREMLEVRDLARSSLRQVRTAVQGYRALDLDEVLVSVRAVLEAAEVQCVIDADTADLPAETRTLLASVVREGATNILKHSTAGRCTITIKDGVLEMVNDGVSGSAAEAEAGGLSRLAQRVSAAGGSLVAEPAEGGFVLRAVVPA